MSLEIFAMMVVVLLAAANIYSQYSWRGKALCLFRRANRTVVEKKIPLKSKYVIFDGGKYRVNPKRIDLMWYTRGIHQLFPMFVPVLEYKWDTDQPLDPTTFTNTWDSPEARKALNQEENIRSLDRAVTQGAGKKESTFQRFLPWITIAILLVVAMWVYQMSGHIGELQQQILAILQTK